MIDVQVGDLVKINGITHAYDVSKVEGDTFVVIQILKGHEKGMFGRLKEMSNETEYGFNKKRIERIIERNGKRIATKDDVKRVAKAIAHAYLSLYTLDSDAWKNWQSEAKAALEAMNFEVIGK